MKAQTGTGYRLLTSSNVNTPVQSIGPTANEITH